MQFQMCFYPQDEYLEGLVTIVLYVWQLIQHEILITNYWSNNTVTCMTVDSTWNFDNYWSNYTVTCMTVDSTWNFDHLWSNGIVLC